MLNLIKIFNFNMKNCYIVKSIKLKKETEYKTDVEL